MALHALSYISPNQVSLDIAQLGHFCVLLISAGTGTGVYGWHETGMDENPVKIPRAVCGHLRASVIILAPLFIIMTRCDEIITDNFLLES